jgi:hypothetical protein
MIPRHKIRRHAPPFNRTEQPWEPGREEAVMRRRSHLLFFALVSVGGCSETTTRMEKENAFSTSALVTTADLRIVTERPNPQPGGAGPKIICTEPSPDVAKSLPETKLLI